MHPSLWGKGFWLMIWSLLYNEKLFNNDIVLLKEYLDVINRNLPCEECREHIQGRVTKNDIMSCNDITRIREFYIWVYNQTASVKIQFNYNYEFVS